MARLIYSAIASLDGYIEDADGTFAWAEPDEEVHGFLNDLERPIGTYLYGRRMYETMAAWETMQVAAELSRAGREFAEIWRAADKIVFSQTLSEPVSARTRVERRFDPEAIRRMIAASPHDISVGGPELAGQALDAGLVDECHLFLHPVVVAGGKPAFSGTARLGLELLDERRFGSGVIYLQYRVGR